MQENTIKYCKISLEEVNYSDKDFYRNNDKADMITFAKNIYKSLEIDYPKFYKMDLLAKLGFLSTEILLQKAELSVEEKENLALFMLSSYSSLSTDCNYQATIGDEYFPSPAVFVYTLPNIVLGEICIRHKIYGENTCIISENKNNENFINIIDSTYSTSDTNHAIVLFVDDFNDINYAEAYLINRSNYKNLKQIIN